jgi:hypothetical protein
MTIRRWGSEVDERSRGGAAARLCHGVWERVLKQCARLPGDVITACLFAVFASALR